MLGYSKDHSKAILFRYALLWHPTGTSLFQKRCFCLGFFDILKVLL